MLSIEHGNSSGAMPSTPIPLILQTLAKITTSQEAILLITPWWPDTVWMGEAIALSLQPPLELPRPALVQQTTQELPELRFVVWILCTVTSALWASLSRSLTSLSYQLKDLFKKSYESARSSWRAWCDAHSVDYGSTSQIHLVSYLFPLFHDQGLALATLGVHRTMISSFLALLASTNSESRLLRRFMKVAFSVWLAAHSQPCLTEDVTQVLDLLKSLGPISGLSLCQPHFCFDFDIFLLSH